MRATIDRDGCISCAQCWTTCPDFFEENPEDGRSQVMVAFRSEGKPGEGTAPQDKVDCVSMAADGCPVQVIHVV